VLRCRAVVEASEYWLSLMILGRYLESIKILYMILGKHQDTAQAS